MVNISSTEQIGSQIHDHQKRMVMMSFYETRTFSLLAENQTYLSTEPKKSSDKECDCSLTKRSYDECQTATLPRGHWSVYPLQQTEERTQCLRGARPIDGDAFKLLLQIIHKKV